MADHGTGASGNRRAALALAFILAVTLVSGCISGRILRGYPGYPFVSFSIPSPPDSSFFELQRSLESEGYPIDYTESASGLINTRTGPDPEVPILLNLVIGEDPERQGWTAVWVAGYERTREGDERINPLDDDLWSRVMEISRRLSDRQDGTEPLGPDERAALEEEERSRERG